MILQFNENKMRAFWKIYFIVK